MPLPNGTASITDAPDISARGSSPSPLLAPWATTGFSTPVFGGSIGHYPQSWHKIYVPKAGNCVVSDNPPGIGSQYSAYTPASGDTYLFVYRGPENVDLNGTGLTLIASNDDSGGASKGMVSWTDPGNSWIYIGHGTWTATIQHANQFTYISYPDLPFNLETIIGRSSVDASLLGGLVVLEALVAGRGEVFTGLQRKVTTPGLVLGNRLNVPRNIDAMLGRQVPRAFWGDSVLSPMAVSGTEEPPPVTVGQLWPRGNP